ncbi:hypothetical protein BDV32DRAFT_152378 [Aspergillus pseudonomiae]|nr:hypothetical protein BDV32DRAFT_152378 [Aspergillus pseudonomiae]
MPDSRHCLTIVLCTFVYPIHIGPAIATGIGDGPSDGGNGDTPMGDTNNVVNDIAQLMDNLTRSEIKRDVIVVRCHAIHTEMDIVWDSTAPGRPRQGRPDIIQRETAEEALPTDEGMPAEEHTSP